MNILQSSVRLAEGGAADATSDLHQCALQQGLVSHPAYGYGKGGKESVSHQNYPQVTKHAPRMTAMASIAPFRLLNHDLFGNFNKLYRTITRTPGPVVPHFHVLHSYWLNLKSVVRFYERVRSHKPDVTLIQTLHDHWSVTGRCAFADGYEGWKTGRQECLTLNNYPPVKTDRAHQLMTGKRQLFHEMLTLGCQFISSSQHVADVSNSLYSSGCCRIVNNGIGMATETILADLPSICGAQGEPKTTTVVYDLHYDGKTNQQLVREMVALSDKIELYTFGKFSPFVVGNVVSHDFETDKRELMSVLNQMNALALSPRVGNHPLTLCEALSIDVPVITIHNGVAQGVLQKFGGKAANEEDVLQPVQLNKPEVARVIFGIALAEFSQCSRIAYSRRQMLEKYVNFYQNLQLSTVTADLPAG